MPRRKRDPNICPMCGTKVEKPYKTWQLVAPMPDAYGRITITVMGMFECPSCGHKWRAVISKIKTGGGEVEVETTKGKKKLGTKQPVAKRQGQIIEIDLDELDEEEEE